MQDRDGFTAFYERYRGEVHAAVAVTVGDRHLATDAVDEAFVRAAERWGEVSRMDRPAGWVYRVAVNWATSWRRKLSRRPTRQTEQLDREHHDRLPDVDLHGELAGLTPHQRKLLVLRYGLDMSIEESAKLLGIAEGTLKSRVHRARATLRNLREATDGHA